MKEKYRVPSTMLVHNKWVVIIISMQSHDHCTNINFKKALKIFLKLVREKHSLILIWLGPLLPYSKPLSGFLFLI